MAAAAEPGAAEAAASSSDALVVGAGPSGSAGAQMLARLGVLDKVPACALRDTPRPMPQQRYWISLNAPNSSKFTSSICTPKTDSPLETGILYGVPT